MQVKKAKSFVKGEIKTLFIFADKIYIDTEKGKRILRTLFTTKIYKFNFYDYKNNLKRNSFITCPHLMELLLMKYTNKEEIIFLDMGADNIDFFLELNSNFKNVKYFFYNLKSVNSIFEKLKFENNYKNLFIINEIDDVLNKKFDFINFGSSIEYFENYEDVLNKASNMGKNIFFSGTTLFDSKNDLTLSKLSDVKASIIGFSCRPLNHSAIFSNSGS